MKYEMIDYNTLLLSLKSIQVNVRFAWRGIFFEGEKMGFFGITRTHPFCYMLLIFAVAVLCVARPIKPLVKKYLLLHCTVIFTILMQ